MSPYLIDTGNMLRILPMKLYVWMTCMHVCLRFSTIKAKQTILNKLRHYTLKNKSIKMKYRTILCLKIWEGRTSIRLRAKRES